MRTCLGCRKTSDKGDLLRIVRTPEGQVMADPTGKANGRGAYVCPNEECIRKVLKSGALSRSLKCRIPETIGDQLLRGAEFSK